MEIVARLGRLNRGLNRGKWFHPGLIRRRGRQGILKRRSVVRMELGCDIWWKRSSVQVMWGLRNLRTVSSAGQGNQWRSESCAYRSQIPTILFCSGSCCIDQVFPPLPVYIGSRAWRFDREGLPVMAHTPLQLLGSISLVPGPPSILRY